MVACSVLSSSLLNAISLGSALRYFLGFRRTRRGRALVGCVSFCRALARLPIGVAAPPQPRARAHLPRRSFSRVLSRPAPSSVRSRASRFARAFCAFPIKFLALKALIHPHLAPSARMRLFQTDTVFSSLGHGIPVVGDRFYLDGQS